jgi:hypothetical protein
MNYTVQRGDTLGTIAQKFLGSSSRWREIWAENPSIRDPNKIIVGQIIKIPFQSSALSTPVAVAKPVETLNVNSSSDKSSSNLIYGVAIFSILGVITYFFLKK